MANSNEATPDGIISILDTDLYKLTMQCAILKYFPDVQITYKLTNRTPHMRLTRRAYKWLQVQIGKLANLRVTEDEIAWLKQTCPYLHKPYLEFLKDFQYHPDSQIETAFHPTDDSNDDSTPGDLELSVHGPWLNTILYETSLLALTSEAYFKFVDPDWDHTGQASLAQEKGSRLIESGCLFSEFGTRRRRDYRTHELVLQGLTAAQKQHDASIPPGPDAPPRGRLTGTSNVHFAMRFGIAPVGTVAHEWFMALAAIDDDYARANERALELWVGAYGRGVLGIALTDTFGTPNFLRAFARPAPAVKASRDVKAGGGEGEVDGGKEGERGGAAPSYADVFVGVRQDSGDPLEFVRVMREFYDGQGIGDGKSIIFSDSLNVERCVEYKKAAEAAGFAPAFGVGTFLTNDFRRRSSGERKVKSVPLNIVIKPSEVQGRPAIKLSDDTGKNMGDGEFVRSVKEQVGYAGKSWEGLDEAHRWDEK